jgi:hypothetical protein
MIGLVLVVTVKAAIDRATASVEVQRFLIPVSAWAFEGSLPLQQICVFLLHSVLLPLVIDGLRHNGRELSQRSPEGLLHFLDDKLHVCCDNPKQHLSDMIQLILPLMLDPDQILRLATCAYHMVNQLCPLSILHTFLHRVNDLIPKLSDLAVHILQLRVQSVNC